MSSDDFPRFMKSTGRSATASLGGNTSRRTLRREVKRLVSLCAGAQIKMLPWLCAGQLQRVEKVQPSWAFLRLYDTMVLGDERCWNAEKWIAES